MYQSQEIVFLKNLSLLKLALQKERQLRQKELQACQCFTARVRGL